MSRQDHSATVRLFCELTFWTRLDKIRARHRASDASGNLKVLRGDACPYDNASCESFVKTLKREEIYATAYRTLEHLATNIEELIEQYYNRCRLHSALGYRPPEEFERAAEGQVSGQPEGATIRFFNDHEDAEDGVDEERRTKNAASVPI